MIYCDHLWRTPKGYIAKRDFPRFEYAYWFRGRINAAFLWKWTSSFILNFFTIDGRIWIDDAPEPIRPTVFPFKSMSWNLRFQIGCYSTYFWPLSRMNFDPLVFLHTSKTAPIWSMKTSSAGKKNVKWFICRFSILQFCDLPESRIFIPKCSSNFRV